MIGLVIVPAAESPGTAASTAAAAAAASTEERTVLSERSPRRPRPPLRELLMPRAYLKVGGETGTTTLRRRSARGLIPPILPATVTVAVASIVAKACFGRICRVTHLPMVKRWPVVQAV